MSNREIKVSIPDVKLPDIPEINIQFLNGEITIPARNKGYVIASGCGSGKTTAIREIIRKRYNYGIVYSAFTIEECNEMYQYCRTFISEEDIIVLHSSYEDEGVDNNLLRNNPEKLADKKVIICTHYKLLNEYPTIFQRYSKNVLVDTHLSKIRRDAIGGFDSEGVKRYPRQLIIVDEMPTCKSLNFNVDKKLLRLLGVADTEERIDREGKKYVTAKSPIHYTNGYDFNITEELFDLNSEGILFNNSTESGKLKNTLALSMIYDNYDHLMNLDKEINLTYTLADHIFNGMDLRILIFDGTGDLTFKNSSVFELLTFKEKYSSPVIINKFAIGYRRRYKSDKEFDSFYNQLIPNLDIEIDKIKDIIKESEGTLIITWKDLKIKDQSKGIPIYGINDKREVEYVDYIRIKLNEEGFIEDKDYSIIHYQSGLDRATNEFRDFSSVVFLGEFHVPGYVVDKFNQDYRVKTDINNYTLYQLVQAVCRTRIRNHKGEGVNIYFTDDWRKEDIENLSNYLSNNSRGVEVRDTSLDFIKPKWKKVAEIFSRLDSEFKRSIESNGNIPYKLEFTLDDIYELVPIKEKQVRAYYPMINYFRRYGIEIKISTNSNNKGSSKF
jgi:hypothetical protein